jgi:hypothetical protein
MLQSGMFLLLCKGLVAPAISPYAPEGISRLSVLTLYKAFRFLELNFCQRTKNLFMCNLIFKMS